MTTAHVLAVGLTAALGAAAWLLAQNRRLRAEASSRAVEADWLRRLLERKGWRADPGHGPAGPRRLGK